MRENDKEAKGIAFELVHNRENKGISFRYHQRPMSRTTFFTSGAQKHSPTNDPFTTKEAHRKCLLELRAMDCRVELLHTLQLLRKTPGHT